LLRRLRNLRPRTGTECFRVRRSDSHLGGSRS
jgi:hypothetical protein